MKIIKTIIMTTTLLLSHVAVADTKPEILEDNKPDLNNPLTRSMYTIVKFVDTYGYMSGGTRACKPDEQIYIESCVDTTLSHWKDINGIDISKIKLSTHDSFKNIVKKEFSEREDDGYQYMLHHNESCDSFIEEEQKAPIWYFCHKKGEINELPSTSSHINNSDLQ